MAPDDFSKVSPAEREYCLANDIPLSKVSPLVRLRRLVAFRNRAHLYSSKCALSGKQIFSSIPPSSRYVVYDIDAWNDDGWDWQRYGRQYDFSRPFFEQFAELYNATPKPNLSVVRSTMENSEYTNGITGAKNCYLVFGASYNEDCMYCKYINYSRNLVDCIYLNKCELCYQCKDCHDCYDLKFSESCHNCSESMFLLNCQGCSNCYGCINLSQKKYYFFNKPLSRDDYERKIAALDLGSHMRLEKEKLLFSQFRGNFPRKYYSGRMNESSSGNFINNCRNAQNSYFVSNCEDVEHCVWLVSGRKSFYHFAYGINTELIYNCGSVGDHAYNLKFCFECWPGARDLEYCILANNGSSDCFGCSSVKKASYCILNKQYSRAEYLDLLPRIKAHMRSTGEYGCFFPASFVMHPFNRSDAMDFLPLSRERAEAEGYSWAEDEVVAVGQPAPLLPDHINDVPDSLIGEQLICSQSKKRYKIIRRELEFYRTTKIPLPRVSPFERLKEFSKFVEVRELKDSKCLKCATSFESAYVGKEAQLLCEACYQDELLGV